MTLAFQQQQIYQIVLKATKVIMGQGNSAMNKKSSLNNVKSHY